MFGAFSQIFWANAKDNVQDPPNPSTSDLVLCFLGKVLHFVHKEDNSPDLKNQPLVGKQQLHTANLLASDGQTCSSYEHWVVSGQGFAIWSLSLGVGVLSLSYESASPPFLSAQSMHAWAGLEAEEWGP